VRFWSVYAVLNLMMLVPTAAVMGMSAIGKGDLIAIDLAFLAGGLVLFERTEWRTLARRVVAGLYLFLLGFEIYDYAVQAAFRRAGILYDDVQHVAGAFHLVWNAASGLHLLIGSLGLFGAAAIAWGVPWGVRQMQSAARAGIVRSSVLLMVCAALPLTGFALYLDDGDSTPTYGESILMVSEKVVANLRASVELRDQVRTLQQRPADSTYRSYGDISLRDRPNLYLLMVESYGSVLQTHPELADPYRQMMQDLERRFAASGWHTASTTSTAPVHGGTSWLSAGSLLQGTPMRHQALYDHYFPKLDRYPHLVWFLDRQGYRTVVLQPPVRQRSGIGVSNPYGFDHTLYFEDLGYDGPRYGWGIVPDQFSLGFAHDHVLGDAAADAPFALFFETTAPHIPWRDPPPLVADWRDLQQASATPIATVENASSVGSSSSLDPGSRPGRFFRTVRYSWEIIARHLLNEAPENSLVLLLGDHQPPLLESDDWSVPVHVLSPDRGLLRAFEEHGFRSGLLPPSPGGDLHHAGLYSLLVHALAPSHASSSSVSPVLPQGVQRPAPLP